MKNIKLLLLALALVPFIQSEAQEKNSLTLSASYGSKDSSIVNGDTTRFKWGNKIVVIFDDTAIHNILPDTFKKNKFRWAGVDFGVNGLLNSSGSMTLKDPAGTAPKDRTDFMDVDLRHSWMLRINPLEFNIRTKNQRIGILTGLGFEWNSYELSNNVRLIQNGGNYVDSSGSLTNAYTWGLVDSSRSYSKNRLKTFTLNVPLLVDINLGKNKDLYLVAGGIFGLNMNSKMKYKSGDGKEKVKHDFNINPLRMSLYAKVGYQGVGFFASYGLNGLFAEDKGPQVTPFSLGISFNSN